jgi:hypothetical protein
MTDEQPEDIPGRPIAWVLSITVLAIAACAVVVWTFGAHRSGEQPAPGWDDVPPSWPFELTSPLERERDAQRDTLDVWTWADRAHTRVRVPVGVAIDRYVAGGGVLR